jgi:putative phosphoesterase
VNGIEMKNDRIAVLSDIHGNRWALEAVIEDIENRDVKSVVNLGDSLYGPLDPAGTADILMALNPISVRGNEDRIIVEHTKSQSTLDYVRDRLTAEHIEFLKSLNITEKMDYESVLFHGTPDSDSSYLIYEVNKSGLRMRGKGGIDQVLKERPEELFLCGHDHLPNVIRLAEDRLVVNPGSVGLPAYSDDVPYRHYVENGDPHARYCLLEKTRSGWSVEQLSIPYDHHAASHMARQNNRDDWAFWLKTGRAK